MTEEYMYMIKIGWKIAFFSARTKDLNKARSLAVQKYNEVWDVTPPAKRLPKHTIVKKVEIWDVEALYDSENGWEVVSASYSRDEARQDIKDYRANTPEYSFRLKLKQVKKEDFTDADERTLNEINVASRTRYA